MMLGVLTVLAATLFAAPADKAEVPKSISIVSDTSDYDRNEGVVMFDGNVVVEYSGEYTLCADRVFVFASDTRELSRVVAIGNVSVTNGTRYGTCAMATYRRSRNEIEMLRSDTNGIVRLVDRGERPCELTGTKIRFWVGTEQVEVDNSSVTVQGAGKERLL